MDGGMGGQVIDLLGQECKEIKSDALDLDPKLHLDRVDWTQDGQVRESCPNTTPVQSFALGLLC